MTPGSTGNSPNVCECLSVLLYEIHTMRPEDRERFQRAVHALEIARNPRGLLFGFGGIRNIVDGAYDDITSVWLNYHPDTPVKRSKWDSFWMRTCKPDAHLDR